MRAATATVSLPPAFEVPADVMALRWRAVLRTLLKQPISVWSVYFYLFFEYVRPQTIYPWIDFLPWAQISLLTAVGAALLTETGKRRWNMIDTGIVIYTVVVFLSLLGAFNPAKGWEDINLYLSWVLVYFVLSTTVNTSTRLLLMLVGWFLWNLKMSLHGFRSWASIGFGFRDWGVTGAPGWFQNSGEFGIQMCVVFPIALYFAFALRKHVSKWTFYALLVLPFTAVTGAIASSSRGALLGMAAIGVWMFLRSRYKVRGAVALVAIGALAYVFVPNEQRDRLSESGEDDTSMSRITYWTRGIEFANESPFLGIGYKSWIAKYEYVWGDELQKGQRVQLPHNFAIEALAELGYTGLLALLFLLAATFVLNARSRAMARKLGPSGRLLEQLGWGFDGALIGFMVSGFFVTVLYYPYLWVNLGMTVGLHTTVRRTLRAAQRGAAAGTVAPVPPPRFSAIPQPVAPR